MVKKKRNWKSPFEYLLKFAGENIVFEQIDGNFCNNFYVYLQKQNLSVASINLYYKIFQSCLNQAIRDKIITSNPAIEVTLLHSKEKPREFLTIEELKKLANTECKNLQIKNAFLFACYSGLRVSDIMKLKWSDLQEMQGQTRIVFNQQKTTNLQYLDLPEQAIKFMGEKGKSNDYIFKIYVDGRLTYIMRDWVAKAGITKKITFHSSRHTFAVMLLTYGADLYTVQKLLGHSSIQTTQIYAKVVDEKKRDAVNRLPNI
jgi:site-specific recombinase XerD